MIVYCTKRNETERVATLLSRRLPSIQRTFTVDSHRRDKESRSEGQGSHKRSKSASRSPKRRVVELTTAAFYHAGVEGPRRDEVQQQFMQGTLRIVVSTMAFGMGLNKRDIRAVIHYDIPKSFESFIQEIGRAGRDGQEAYCHIFIDEMVRIWNSYILWLFI